MFSSALPYFIIASQTWIPFQNQLHSSASLWWMGSCHSHPALLLGLNEETPTPHPLPAPLLYPSTEQALSYVHSTADMGWNTIWNRFKYFIMAWLSLPGIMEPIEYWHECKPLPLGTSWGLGQTKHSQLFERFRIVFEPRPTMVRRYTVALQGDCTLTMLKGRCTTVFKSGILLVKTAIDWLSSVRGIVVGDIVTVVKNVLLGDSVDGIWVL